MTEQINLIALVRQDDDCRRHPIVATPSGEVWGWDGPMPTAQVTEIQPVDAGFFLLKNPSLTHVPVRDVLRSSCNIAHQVENPERLKGRDGEPVYVYHDGFLRPARIDLNLVEASAAVSWEDAASWTSHVWMRPGWGEVVEAYCALAKLSAEAERPIAVGVPFVPHTPTLERLILSGPSNTTATLRALLEAVEGAGYGSIWDLPDPLYPAAEALIEELFRFIAGEEKQ